MIIKMMLDELFIQLKEVSQFENIEMIKVVDSKFINEYYKCSESAKNELLDKLNELTEWKNNMLNTIKDKKFNLNEENTYEISGENKTVTSYTVPVLFKEEVAFFINMISFNKTDFTEGIKEDIDEIVSSFVDVFCFDEMMKLDMVRDRISAVA